MLQSQVDLTRMSQTLEGTLNAPPQPVTEFPHIICKRFLLRDPLPEERILDVGCGHGELMNELMRIGCHVVGTEISSRLIDSGLSEGLDIRPGAAEHLPFENNSFDRVLCSMVVPYTDERRAVSEWARVVRPGGRVFASYHGIGYPLYQLLRMKSIGVRFYGIRTLLNTYCYWATGRRLPGFLGDSLCQGMKQLNSYYISFGLELEHELVADSIGRYPRFICHQLRKPVQTS